MAQSTLRIFSLMIMTSAFCSILAAQSTNPAEKPKNVGRESKDTFKKWIEEDVPYIISPAERKAYLALRTDEERANFIELFWRSRDPDPDTEENEYREEYYERIAYANEHFSSGKPGWRTDRGRIYITHGKPDSVESRPAGGSYDRPSWEGGGSTTTYPFEIWFYRHLDDVGDGLEVEFVDPSGTGEYRLARDADEKDALKTVPGAGSTTAELLGFESRASRLSGRQPYQRDQDTLFSRMNIEKRLFSPPSTKFKDLEKLIGVDTGFIRDKDPVEFDVRIDFFRQSDDRVITTFTIQTSNRELQFVPSGGLQQATMNIFGRVTSVSGKRPGIFEESVVSTSTTAELAENKEPALFYQKAVALEPGSYKIDIVVRDVGTGNRGLRSVGFAVPRYDDSKLSTSSLVLASKLRPTDKNDVGARFVIGQVKVVPNVSGIYKQGQEIGLYLQVYNAGIDQTTLRPAVDVDYVILKDGKELRSVREDWNGLGDSAQRLTLARQLPTTGLEVGDYEIKVNIRDRVGGQVIENKGKFTIAQ